MRTLLKASGIAAALAFAAFAPGAVAQEINKNICQGVGANGPPRTARRSGGPWDLGHGGNMSR